MRNEEKYKLEKEIGLINSSKEISKFDYSLHSNITISIMILFMPLLISLIIEDFRKNILLINLLLIVYLLFIGFMYFFRLNRDKKEFEQKHKMVRERYEKLGIKVKKIDDELKKIQ